MAERENRITNELDLTHEQVSRLQKAFENQTADVLRGAHAESTANANEDGEKTAMAKPKPKAKNKNQVV